MDALVNPGPLLPNSNVVVTGGGKGIGRGIVDSFLAHGANVLCVDNDVDESLAAAERATDQLRVLDLDVTASSAAKVIAQHCDADVVVNNVGHFLRPPRNFVEETQQDWDELFRVNLDHVFRVTAGLLPGMISRANGGSVITLTTVEAFRGIPGHAAYSAANAGLTGWTRSMALENGKHGIRFNAIAPDLIETPQVPYHQLVEQDDWWRWRTSPAPHCSWPRRCRRSSPEPRFMWTVVRSRRAAGSGARAAVGPTAPTIPEACFISGGSRLRPDR